MSKSIILTALDIGTGAIKGLCARKDLKDNKVEILAQAELPCLGVRNGEIVKPQQVSRAIQQVSANLAGKADVKIREVLVNIGGSHLFSVVSQGLVSVSRADQKISKEDIARVIKEAETVNLPSNKEVLDIFPQEFIVDGEIGIKDPMGLEGIRLESKVLLVCVFSPVLENLEVAVEEAGLDIEAVYLSPLASARAVLTEEQKELGVALVDIGFGTTSIAVFERGEIKDFHIFPVGASNITNDIAIGLRVEIKTAERIKRDFATLKTASKKGAKEKLKVPETLTEFSRKFLNDIVESRVGEIFNEVEKSLKKISKAEPLPSGVVLTGGGAKMPGIVEFAKQRFKLPCRLAEFERVKGLDEMHFSTALGLLLLGFDVAQGATGSSSGGSGFGRKIKRIFRTFLP